jgi:hypothetical protein
LVGNDSAGWVCTGDSATGEGAAERDFAVAFPLPLLFPRTMPFPRSVAIVTCAAFEFKALLVAGA